MSKLSLPYCPVLRIVEPCHVPLAFRTIHSASYFWPLPSHLSSWSTPARVHRRQPLPTRPRPSASACHSTPARFCSPGNPNAHCRAFKGWSDRGGGVTRDGSPRRHCAPRSRTRRRPLRRRRVHLKSGSFWHAYAVGLVSGSFPVRLLTLRRSAVRGCRWRAAVPLFSGWIVFKI